MNFLYLLLFLSSFAQMQAASDLVKEEKTDAADLSTDPKQKRHDPLVILSRVPVDRWELNDKALAFELALALREPQVLQEVMPLRDATVKEWLAWQSAVKKEDRTAAHSTLRSALTKKLSPVLKKHTVASSRASIIAERIMQLAPLDGSYIQDMVVRIHGRHKRPNSLEPAIAPSQGYQHLFLTVLGYDYDAAAYHTKMEVHAGAGVLLTDHQCLRQSVAQILVAYTAAYDASLTALQNGLELSFWNAQHGQEDVRKAWLLHWKEQWYRNPTVVSPLKEQSEAEQHALRQWQELMQGARAKAHERARSVLDEGLREVWNGVCSLNARLDVLRVSDAAFAFPSVGIAQDDALRVPQVYSLLVGMTRVCLQKVLVDDGVLDANVLQLVLGSEMVAQRKHRHIPSDIPTGAVNAVGKIVPLSVSPEQAKKDRQLLFDGLMRRSYEAKMYVTNGLRMDVLRGEGEQEDLGRGSDDKRYSKVPIARALEGFEVNRGIKMYTEIMVLYGELNRLRWRLVGARSHAQVMSALGKKLREVEAYLTRLEVPVADKAAVQSYRKVIQHAVPWGKTSSITFAHARSLRAQLATVHAKDAEKQAAAARNSYRAMYQLMWLCIWHRLSTVVVLKGHEQAVGAIEKFETRSFEDSGVLAAPTSAELHDGQGRSSQLLDAFKPIAQELDGVPAKLRETFRKMTRRGKKIKGEGIEKALKDGDASVLIGEVDGMLDEVATFFNGFEDVLTGVYRNTESTYKVLDKQMKRGVATSKAMMVYGHWLGKYSQKKLTGMQAMLQQLLNSKMIRLALWAAPKMPGHKTLANKVLDAMRLVSEEDVEISNNMALAQDNLVKAMDGKLKADDIKMPSEQSAAPRKVTTRMSVSAVDAGDLYGLNATVSAGAA